MSKHTVAEDGVKFWTSIIGRFGIDVDHLVEEYLEFDKAFEDVLSLPGKALRYFGKFYYHRNQPKIERPSRGNHLTYTETGKRVKFDKPRPWKRAKHNKLAHRIKAKS
jgi:hypothetical protein